MQKIVISGIRGYDGEYPIDLARLTMGDLRTVKRLSRVRAGEIIEALTAGDTDVVVALAVVAMEKSGKYVVEDAIWNSVDGSIDLDLGEDEVEEGDDASPPAVIPLGPPELPASGSEKPPSTGRSSGSDSVIDGDDSPETNLRAIGSQV